MKHSSIILFTTLLLCFNCSNEKFDNNITTGAVDDNISTPVVIEESSEPTYIKTMDFSSSIDYVSEIESFDIDNGYLYFDYQYNIYRINLEDDNATAELIIEDDEAPVTLKVINNQLYYQTYWPAFSSIKQLDVNNIAGGTQVTPVIDTPRSLLIKNDTNLYYVSSPNGLSPINNFYQFNTSGTDNLVATDEFVIPKNGKVIDNFLYFSSENNVHRIDLNSPSQGSSIVYTAEDIEDAIGNEGYILGFDIHEDKIYYSQIGSTNLYSFDLNTPTESPKIIQSNNNNTTGYSQLIIYNDVLYVKRLLDKQLEVFEI